MSPEQADGRRDQIGPASDVYSLGAHALCAADRPGAFGPGQISEILEKVRRSDFPRPRQVKKGVDPALEAVCLKAMDLRPHNRYGTAPALAGDLEQWLAGEPVGAWREPAGVRVRRWVGRHGTLVAAAAVALAAGAVLSVVTAFWFAAADRAQAAGDREATQHELAEVRRGNWRRRPGARFLPNRRGRSRMVDRPIRSGRLAAFGMSAGAARLGVELPGAARSGRCGRRNAGYSWQGGLERRVQSRRRPRGFGRPRRDGRVWDVATRKILFDLETTPAPGPAPGPSPGRRVQPRRRPTGDRRRLGRPPLGRRHGPASALVRRRRRGSPRRSLRPRRQDPCRGRGSFPKPARSSKPGGRRSPPLGRRLRKSARPLAGRQRQPDLRGFQSRRQDGGRRNDGRKGTVLGRSQRRRATVARRPRKRHPRP